MRLGEDPQGCSLDFPTWLVFRVRLYLRLVTDRDGVLTYAAAGVTSRLMTATGWWQFGQFWAALGGWSLPYPAVQGS